MATNPLTREQLKELKRALEHQLARLERSMEVTSEAVKPVELDQASVGRLSRMDSLQSQGLAKGLQEREVARWALIQAALRRMDEGTYGVCTDCGASIAYGRLLVFPESATCAACGG